MKGSYQIRRALAIGIMLASSAGAEVHKLVVDKNSPEGQFLDLVTLESDAAKKIALLEQFLNMFPRVDPNVTAWVYGELQERYRRAGAIDKALAAGERILAIEPDNVEVARANWRLAETKKDEALVKHWAEETAKIAERVVKAPLPSDPEALKAAEDRALYARQFIVNTDYEDFTSALKTQDAAQRIAALKAFSEKSPQNPYQEQIEIATFLAWKELGDVDNTLAAAERVLARNENREDAMIFVAEINFRRKKDPQRTVSLASKFIERMATAAKPDGMSDEDWTRSKNRNLALAHYFIGGIRAQSNQWAAVDKEYRAALPFVADEQFRATLLYQLGYANYQLHNALDAIKFYKLCAAIPSAMQDQASKNVLAVKAEYNVP
jgi:tetratricopeptide (TPR) repeat protein